MNRFTGPICGVGAHDTHRRFSPYWNVDVARCEEMIAYEVGERVARPLLASWGENCIGSGYEYVRRQAVLYRARESKPAPVGQMALL